MSGAKTARAVVLNPDGALLVMERWKHGQHYFSLPGGHLEDIETPEHAVVREVLEETGVTITVARLLYTCIDIFNNHQSIFLCDYIAGEPHLPQNSEEAEWSKVSGQVYKPQWRTPEQLRDVTLYPLGLLDELTKDIVESFANTPREIVDPRQSAV